MMDEIELRLQVPIAQRVAVDAAVAGRAPRPRQRLQAAYYDTAERALARAGVALRMRREGRYWVQTLKGPTRGGLARAEHNAPRGGTSAMPAIELALHAATPVGAALPALLGARGAAALAIAYRTDILRRTRVLRSAQGRVELAFDAGTIAAGDQPLHVHELEIELLAGSPLAVLDTARRWLPRFGLWLDVRSKAERGDLLARGATVAPPRQADEVRLTAAMSMAAAWQAVLRSCAEQIIANASQIASGEHAAEHVHQLRVGLRRLRSAASLFEGMGVADAPWGDAAAALFRRLGAARDGVVIEGEFAAELRAAMERVGIEGDLPRAAAAALDAGAPTAVLRETDTQMLLLDLLAAVQHGDAPVAAAAGVALRDQLAQRLNHWHRQLLNDTKRFGELDDASRHTLRKRAKRLRYAAEFCAALFERRAVRRYLRALRALQERLGALSDVLMATQVFAQGGGIVEPEAQRLFALGWLAARRDALIAAAAPELKAFGKVERFWKRK